MAPTKEDLKQRIEELESELADIYDKIGDLLDLEDEETSEDED